MKTAHPQLTLDDAVQFVKGIGPARAQALSEVGVHTVKDLLYYFPRRYLDRRSLVSVSDLRIGDQATIIGQVTGKNLRHTRRRKFFQAGLADETGSVNLIWFQGYDWIQNRFQTGDRLMVHGRVEFYRDLQFIHPEIDVLDDEDTPVDSARILPLYPESAGLKAVGLDSRRFRRVISGVWERLGAVPDHHTNEMCRVHDLLPLDIALRQIHFPDDEKVQAQAVFRLKFDEHFFLQLLMALRRRFLHTLPGQVFPDRGNLVEQIYRRLPFQLTDAQIRVMREIRSDFQSGRMMNRLLQGDVGSGKTVVALLAGAIVAGQDYQTAIMAPTEILAEQHFRSISELSRCVDLPLALLTGSTPKDERANLLEELRAGRLPLIIGTHALIQRDVVFRNLALLIIDEQHRFGVVQRGRLMEKGTYPHVLAMSATPIPRTLAMTYHGDMDVSVLDQLPKGRARVKTYVISGENMARIYDLVRKETAAAH
ncbi:ATP-dependent DNA helicase RecG, partial [Candidatus Neomarinimicrobiota bacterium]